MDRSAPNYSIFETASGFCGIAWRGTRIARFRLPDQSAAAVDRHFLYREPGAKGAVPPVDIEKVIASAMRYFKGENIDFSSVAIDLSGREELFARIYAAARGIAWGRTTTYGTLAKELGLGPEFARDVGRAMAKNPVPLIIPCHRVLAAGDKVGGFSAPGGSASKLRMLELEGVHIGPSETAQQSLQL